MREIRRYQLANGEVAYSFTGFHKDSIVVYCERDGDKWKITKGKLNNPNISKYGLAMKHITKLGTVRKEEAACNLAKLVLIQDDLPDTM